MSQRGYRRQAKPKGLFGQIQQTILHPIAFFEALPNDTAESRTWLWVALLILAIIGYTATQQTAPEVASSVPVSTTQVIATNEANDIQDDLVTGLTASALMVIAWLGQAIVMMPIVLLNKKRPNFNLSLQIAIWASVPLAISALIRLALFAVGLESGYAGVSGVVIRYPELWNWENIAQPLQILIIQITSHLTIFALWNAILLYLGVRYSIKSNRWFAWLYLVLWIVFMLLIPTIFESVLTEPTETSTGF